MIEQGDVAPDFTLSDQDGNEVSLSKLRGKAVVLYFYPKADTPGCTTQACGVRDHRSDYKRAGAVVLGVSPDPVAKLKRFAEKYNLDFPLLADEDHAVAEAYGVWVEKSMYGRKYMGNERTTFVIDPDGTVAGEASVLGIASPYLRQRDRRDCGDQASRVGCGEDLADASLAALVGDQGACVEGQAGHSAAT